jgi:tRNA threonylcarbamoyladenosine biosynthesis protein TsaB
MNVILALETTEKFGSVALLDGKRLLAEVQLPRDRRSAQTLAPAIDTILRETRIAPQEVAVVAVVVGPGSFTGLRVGAATAKMFAYAVKSKVIGINTFDAVTGTCSSVDCDYLSVGVDAQRGEVVTSLFQHTSNGQWKAVAQSELISVADWWKQADQWKNVVFSGPALERWHTKTPQNVVLADEPFWFPKASVVGLIAAEYSLEDRCFPDDFWSLVPVYSRLSAAEEKRAEK